MMGGLAIGIGPVVGEALADLLIGNETRMDVAPFGPDQLNRLMQPVGFSASQVLSAL